MERVSWDYSRTAGNKCVLGYGARIKDDESSLPPFHQVADFGFSLSLESLTYAAAVRIINFGSARDLKVVLPPNRLDALRPGVPGDSHQAVGTDDRSASFFRIDGDASDLGNADVLLDRVRIAYGRSNDGIRSRYTSHESSISCYRRYHAESVEDTIVHLAPVVHVLPL